MGKLGFILQRSQLDALWCHFIMWGEGTLQCFALSNNFSGTVMDGLHVGGLRYDF